MQKQLNSQDHRRFYFSSLTGRRSSWFHPFRSSSPVHFLCLSNGMPNLEHGTQINICLSSPDKAHTQSITLIVRLFAINSTVNKRSTLTYSMSAERLHLQFGISQSPTRNHCSYTHDAEDERLWVMVVNVMCAARVNCDPVHGPSKQLENSWNPCHSIQCTPSTCLDHYSQMIL